MAVLAASRAAANRGEIGEVVETTFRGSGAGGQHRNKTDSCVRLVHVESGTAVVATESRSQWQNRQAAWAELRSRLQALSTAAAAKAENDERSTQIGGGGRGSYDWTWCAWRDTVDGPGGRKSMRAALKGDLPV